jgi:ribosomal protein S18 acetylase RimI-like enzyme
VKPFRIERLSKQHDRSTFDCGTEVLNEYLRKRAGREQRKNFSACYLAIDNATDAMVGFYALSSGNIALHDLAPALQKKLPRYDAVPIARIGRLAVDTAYGGRGLGAALIIDSIKRVVASGIGIYAIVVDAKDDREISFYRHVGFESLPKAKDILYLPVSTALALIDPQ